MTEEAKPVRVLLVDAEPRVLEGIAVSLRRRYTVETASTAAAALDLLARLPDLAVVLGDLPPLDGVPFAAAARKVAPQTVRVVLTGETDLKAAITAVNEGQVFRYLTKPCPASVLLPALEAAVEHHRALSGQPGLADESLQGALTALFAVLAAANPAASGRAARVGRTAGAMAATLRLSDPGAVELAGRLAQLGFLALPPELALQLHRGGPLTAEQTDQVLKVSTVAERMLGDLPRLASSRRLLAACVRPVKRLADGADEKSRTLLRASQTLRLAMDFDDLAAQKPDVDQALAPLRARDYDPDVVEALAAAAAATAITACDDLPVSGLRRGMVVGADVLGVSGTLLLARGSDVTTAFLERARALGPGAIQEPVRVAAGTGTAEAAPRPMPPEVPL